VGNIFFVPCTFCEDHVTKLTNWRDPKTFKFLSLSNSIGGDGMELLGDSNWNILGPRHTIVNRPFFGVWLVQEPLRRNLLGRPADWLTRSLRTASRTYICVLSLCHLYSFTSYLKSHKCKLPKDTFLVHSSHNFTPKRNELRYHCCLSQLYFIGH
jgi:hypothetical protein